MTNQEAISVLESINAKTDYYLINDDARAEAIDMAISALQMQEAKHSTEGSEELKQEVKNSNGSSLTHKALDTISRQAVAYLDLFTKTYCRDYSVTDDLVFRCKECEFKAYGGKCLVKCMARMLCPDYKEFGCMGDL